MSSFVRIGDGIISSIKLLRPSEMIMRLDVLPFIICYLCLFGCYFFKQSDEVNGTAAAAAAGSAAGSETTKFWIAGIFIFILQLVMIVGSTSSIDIQSWVGYGALDINKCSDDPKKSVVLVKAAPNCGKDRIVPLMKTTGADAALGLSRPPLEIAGASFQFPSFQFEFQKVMYHLHSDNTDKGQGQDIEAKGFAKRRYPIRQSLRQYFNHGGYEDHASLALGQHQFGHNEFDIPLPSFLELYVEHLVAPFFLFQVVCLVLWSLDDYWYYSVMTLALLMFFESMLCRQRLNSLQMLRNMRQPPYPLFVYRPVPEDQAQAQAQDQTPGQSPIPTTAYGPGPQRKWVIESSQNLLPGDIVSLTSQNVTAQRPKLFLKNSGAAAPVHRKRPIEPLVPCDILLLTGSCIVNEAMLTGESIPQTKESVAGVSRSLLDTSLGIREEEGDLSSSSSHTATGGAAGGAGEGETLTDEGYDWKRHVLYGGTSIVLQQHTAQSGQSHDTTLQHQVPLAPDGGSLGVVLRTGYGTTQGGLMRKILFATERVNGYSTESILFIFMLVCVAFVSSSVVLYHTYNDPSRDQYKVFLHCIMIVTSVVPPELPMELSLSVTNSLAALSRTAIFCTEPFRIPFAGKLSVLCFDKTGTLTKDKLLLKGIVAPVETGTLSYPPVLFGFENISQNKVYSVAPRSSGGSSSGVDEDLECLPSQRGAAGSDVGLSRQGTAESAGMVEMGVDADGHLPLGAARPTIYAPYSCADLVQAVMGSCHAVMDLSRVNKGVVGDPMELCTLEASGFSLISGVGQTHGSTPSGSNVVVNEEANVAIRTIHRYAFSSALKRMSVIVQCSSIKSTGSAAATAGPGSSSSGSGSGNTISPSSVYYVFTKGAPEVLAGCIRDLPAHYHATYTHHMSRGKRVIALCYKAITLTASVPPKAQGASSSSSYTLPSHQWKDLQSSRDTMEHGLTFVGFAVYDCDLKPDTKTVMKELKQSDHHVVIITGDSVYTAIDIGKKISIIPKPATPNVYTNVLVLQPLASAGGDRSSDSDTRFVWRSADRFVQCADERQAGDADFSVDALAALSAGAKLCITGPVLDALLASGVVGGSAGSAVTADAKVVCFARVCPHITIYARVAPLQKELIVLSYNHAGVYTLMCGDGTNDVGALKAAHVGVSIINDADFEGSIEDGLVAAQGLQGQSSSSGASLAKRRMDRAMSELNAQQQDATVVKLGDASIASPFTARRTSVDVVLTLLKQGRCTLVTTIQVYKILALNCLATAFTMSFLYLKGLKQGDTQMTVFGLMLAGLFFVISQAKPLARLSKEKPPGSVFDASVLCSILGQCVTHIGCLYATSLLCGQYELVARLPGMLSEAEAAAATGAATSVEATAASGDPSDEVFRPNLINTAIFLVTSTIQVNNFAINYYGHPYMQSFADNVMLHRSVVGIYLVLMVLVGGQLEPLNDLFELIDFNLLRPVLAAGEVPVPNAPSVAPEFQGYLLSIMLSSAMIGWTCEYLARKLEKQ